MKKRKMDANQLAAHFISELRQLEPRSEDASNKLRASVFQALWAYTDSELFTSSTQRVERSTLPVEHGGGQMTLVDIESVINWLDENIDSYDIELGDAENMPVRTFYDLKVDIRKWAEKGGKNDSR